MDFFIAGVLPIIVIIGLFGFSYIVLRGINGGGVTFP